MADVEIVRARPADAGPIAHVHRLSRAHYYGVPADADDDREAMWAHLVGQPGRVTYVARELDTVVGFVSSGGLELTALYVLPTHIGRGIGSRLHDVFAAGLPDGSSAMLEVWAGNRRAIDFYRQRGWVATTVSRPGPQDQDFVTYRLRAAGADVRRP